MRLIAIVVILSLAACAPVTRSGQLYSASNGVAGGGILSVQYVDTGLGHGPIKIAMNDGEVLNGEYRTVDHSNATTGFGRIYTYTGYGAYGSSIASRSTALRFAPGSSPGYASLIGTRGTTMQCEYIVNRGGSGVGACETGDNRYRLNF